MLYRTHHHSLCLPIQSIYLLPPSTTAAPLRPPFLQLPSSPPSIEAEHGMECVEIALKSSLRPETVAAKATTQQAVTDDLWAVNGQSGVSGDEFFVDDLLDFSKGDIEEGFVEENGQDTKASCVSVSPKGQKQQTEEEKHFEHRGDAFSVKEDFGSVPASELSVPADDLADLEWLSHFVEDSFSEYSLTFPAVKLSEESRAESETPVQTKPCFATPVQTKARSKRVRAGGRVWSLGSPSLTESSSSTSTSSSSTSSSSPSNPWLIYASSTQTAESFLGKPPAKRPKKKKPTFGTAAVAPGGGGGPQFPRRCSHCLVQKTPQWRAGPLGAKTLCNACGVRYKSGRLLPEYRPACSPTFSSDIHSNNHRKVLEMRRKKESASGLAPPVQSF